MIAVNFSFQGTELVGIARVRVKIQRKRSRRQLTIQFGVYLFSLYYLFLFLLDYSLGEAGVIESPFVVVFDKIGILYAPIL